MLREDSRKETVNAQEYVSNWFRAVGRERQILLTKYDVEVRAESSVEANA